MAQRGRLKIFLGYAAGVGKTYAMLEAVRQKIAEEHVDAVIGIAVTHGRQETEKLLEGIEVIPLLQVEYKGTILHEMNLDLLLQRKPALAVVDELAHTNVPGLRHPKRYLDVEELLDAGIDVFTTLNVQHIESYQDPIEQVIGLPVRERIPDKIIDEADEIEIIDLPPRELLIRLEQGKVYIPEQAVRAISHFFKMETLQTLREMTLRKAAAIIDLERTPPPQIGRPEEERSRAVVSKLHLKPKLLASIGPSPFSERILRTTKRLADMLKAEWYAVSVETPELSLASDEMHRKQVDRYLRFAEELGGVSTKLSGPSVAEAVLSFAKSHGITQIVVGHSLRSWYQRLFHKSPVDELVTHSPSIDLYVTSSALGLLPKVDEGKESHPSFLLEKRKMWRRIVEMVWPPLVAVLVMTGLLLFLSHHLTAVAIGLVYLLSTTLAAACFSPFRFYFYFFSSMAMLQAFFIPNFGEKIFDPLHGGFFLAICCLAVFINVLTSYQKKLVKVLRHRHDQIRDLYDLNRQLVQVNSCEKAVALLQYHFEHLFSLGAVVAMMDGAQPDMIFYGFSSQQAKKSFQMTTMERMAARWVFDHGEGAGKTTDTLPSAEAIWLPLVASGARIGALALFSLTPEEKPLEEIYTQHREDIEAYVHLAALSLSRLPQRSQTP